VAPLGPFSQAEETMNLDLRSSQQWPSSWMWHSAAMKNMPKSQQEGSSVVFTFSLLLVCHTPGPSSWRRCFPSKCPWTCTPLQGITSQKTVVLFLPRKFAYRVMFKQFQNMLADHSLCSRENSIFLK
jgi:hypothetical protein